MSKGLPTITATQDDRLAWTLDCALGQDLAGFEGDIRETRTFAEQHIDQVHPGVRMRIVIRGFKTTRRHYHTGGEPRK